MAHQQRSPFDIAEDRFTIIGSRLFLDGRTIGRGLPARPIPLDELRCILLHPSVSFEARDAVLVELIHRARSRSALWMSGLIGVVLPGVRRRVGPMTRACPPRRDDIEAEALFGLIDAIARRVEGGERIASKLVWASVRSAHRFVKTECAQQAEITLAAAPEEPHWPWGHPDLVLARAVEANAISMDEARMIGATYLDRMTLKGYAAATGIGYQAARKRRQRALKRLVAWLVEGTVSPKRR